MGFPFPSCLRCVVFIAWLWALHEDLRLLLKRVEKLASQGLRQLLKIDWKGFKTVQTVGDFPMCFGIELNWFSYSFQRMWKIFTRSVLFSKHKNSYREACHPGIKEQWQTFLKWLWLLLLLLFMTKIAVLFFLSFRLTNIVVNLLQAFSCALFCYTDWFVVLRNAAEKGDAWYCSIV